MMHVAFFNRSYWPDAAATGQLLTDLCETLVREYGYRVSVVAGVPQSGPAPRRWHVVTRERHQGVQILRARGARFSKRRFAGRATNYVTYFLSACLAGLRLEKPDVVVALTDPPIIGLAAFLAARRFGAPLVMSYRDIFPEVARLMEDFQSDAVNRLLHDVNRFLVRKAARTVALGETMRQRLVEGKGADPRRTVVIPDWADCSAIVPGPRPNAFSAAHGLTDTFVVMHSGNIGLSQGLEVLVAAAARLQVFPDIRILLVGDGVKKPALEAEVRRAGLRNVIFLPPQPRDRLGEVFAAAHLQVVSLKRGLAGYIVPSKLYGILASGRPYVAAVEEESEVVAITRKYDCGLVAAPGDPDDLADKILGLYRDRALSERLAANARHAALAFDRRAGVRAYHELLDELVRSTGERTYGSGMGVSLRARGGLLGVRKRL